MVTKAEIKKLIDDAVESRDEQIGLLEENVEALVRKDNKIKLLEEKIEWLTSAKQVSDCFRDLMLRKIDTNEQYARKQNLIVNGMRVSKDDNDDKIRDMLFEEIERLEVPIENFEIVRAHRTGKGYTDRDGKRHTPVIVRFSTWRSRDLVYRARKKSRFYFAADLTEDRAKTLQTVQNKIEEEGSLTNELVNFACADRNCNLMISSKDGRIKLFNTVEEFERLLVFLEASQPPYAVINKLIENDKKQKYTGMRLVNLNEVEDVEEWIKDPKHKYIGRAHGNLEESTWANPYRVNEHGRAKAIKMYSDKIWKTPSLMTSITDLEGFDIGCWCIDDCHGQVLIDIVYAKLCEVR